ncbi:T9SS type A sorting domain-containing protein [Hymenobacter chitinivorans]|uniref:Putative delta-60 repeat protein/predicted secreted protein (Por secretion system target) n=1 Tax=Hymenobacter chitinivorans DSM 11115 TaxID=1121954 RepID=A0A2M9B5H4_9BACT|nr:T9SS type A sorting domain-containing protein [Hymenobacter chitinivorans]PJJ53189.1 putative delta-60 repeat protein/predicted secreted protein (Por secretion system target) [Hymenobacter chitinivorans DSM 11115]
MSHKLLVVFLLLLAAHFETRAQSVDPTFAPVTTYATGAVTAMALQADGKYIVSGNFNRVNGAAASTLVRLNADGSFDQGFAANVRTRSAFATVTVLPSGHLLVTTASGVVSLNGQNYNSPVKLNADGTVASSFSVGSGAQGSIRALTVQPDGKVLLAGPFTTFNGSPAPGLVRLNPDGSVDQAFSTALGTGFNNEIFAIALESTGNILVAGTFSNFNNTGRRALLRLRPSGALDTSYNPLVTNANATAAGVAIDPTTDQAVVYGLVGAPELIRLNTDGSQDGSFVAALPSYCVGFTFFNNRKLLVDDFGRVILARNCVTGSSTGVGSQYVTRYLASGAVDPQFSAAGQPNNTVNAIVRHPNGQVLLGGYFTQYGSMTETPIVRLTDQGPVDATFRPVLDASGSVQRIVRQADGKLVAAGFFREINGLAAWNVARLNADGTLDASFSRPTIDGAVQTLALQPDGKILLGGNFSTVAGVATNSLVRLLPSGTVDPSFTSPVAVRAGVAALALQPDGAILVGGSGMLTINGRSAYLHRLLPNGQPDLAYAQNVGTGPSGSVQDIALLPDGRHYVAGFFTRTNGVFAESVVRLLPTGELDPGFQLPASLPTLRTILKVLPVDNNQVLLAGSFSGYSAFARPNLVRLNADGTVDPTLNAALSGSQVSALYQQPDGKIIVGTISNQFVAGVSQGVLFRLTADGALDNSFIAGPSQIDASVAALVVQPDGKLVIGGTFGQVYGQARPAIARIIAPNVLAVANKQREVRTEAWPVPAHSKLHLRLDATARPESVEVLDNLGRVVLTQPASKAELSLPVHHLRAGQYLLRVNYADGPVTRRVVVE